MQRDDDTYDLSHARSPRGGYKEFTPLSSIVDVEFGGCSHPGHRRAINDDHYLMVRFGRSQDLIATSLPKGSVPERFDEYGYGMVVADGMGGLGSEAASRLAVSTLAHLVLHFGRWNVRVNERIAWEIRERAERFYREVDETVTEAAHNHPSFAGMGTTLTACFTGGEDAFIVHVGHSRAYLYRRGLLSRITRDQTIAQRLAETGRASPTQLASADLRHILTDAIGGLAGEPHIAIDSFHLYDGDLLMLCTNGLTDLVSDEEIAKVLQKSTSVQNRCQALVDLALNGGGTDNVTVLVAKYTIPKLKADAVST
jgi:protein phosphatase